MLAHGILSQMQYAEAVVPGVWTPPGTPLIYSDANDAPSGAGGVWPDKSGNGYDAAVGSGVTYIGSGNTAYFAYNNSTGGHIWDYGMWSNHSPYTAFSIVIVYKPNFQANDQQKIIGFGSGAVISLQPDYQLTNNTGRAEVKNSGGTWVNAGTVNNMWAASTWETYALIWTGAVLQLYKGSTLQAQNTLTSFRGAEGSTALTVGTLSNRPAYGSLATVLFYDSAISTADLADIDTEFSSRYGY